MCNMYLKFTYFRVFTSIEKPIWPIQSLAQNILKKRETKSFKFLKREEGYFDLSLPQKYSVLEVEFGERSKQLDWGWGIYQRRD